MGLFFKKKEKPQQKVAVEMKPQKVKKYEGKTSGMITEIKEMKVNSAIIVLKYAIGDRKYFLTQKPTSKQTNIQNLDVGDVFVILYNKEDPSDAIVEDFVEQ